jgi:hypothetical protein
MTDHEMLRMLCVIDTATWILLVIVAIMYFKKG